MSASSFGLALAVFVALAASMPLEEQGGARHQQERQQAHQTRPQIITKHNFRPIRQRKSDSFSVPKPFVVSTELNVKDWATGRRGRTWQDNTGATVVEGEMREKICRVSTLDCSNAKRPPPPLFLPLSPRVCVTVTKIAKAFSLSFSLLIAAALSA